MSAIIRVIANGVDLPFYATEGASGFDIKATNEHDLEVRAWDSAVIPTGLFVEIPVGYEMQIRSRSGLAFNNNIQAHFGTIDSDYRGEIKVKLFNLSHAPFTVKKGDRIAQGVVAKTERVHFILASELSESARGVGGFGSTGV